MDLTIVTSIIAPASALLGVALASRSQLRTVREAQAAQFHVETMKLNASVKEKHRAEVIANYIEVHKALSYLTREYSFTSMDIMVRAGISEEKFDRKYLISCERLDGARALVEMHFAEIFKPVDEIYAQMNIFWGNFKEALNKIKAEKAYAEYEAVIDKARQSSLAITECAQIAKRKLNGLASEIVN
ncbi:hypothetical protein [Pseudomonas mandelii]|uniref:DUF4760 domain-containing protein n=1 Tax=Pseudomonas mandelii TaxID=75612 RepID=A0A502II07_9PSED|nr:hypothetical protein [Pseudomonas mandelii]TPG84800.1 hypothetical protein EAH74_12320 [Pseudomonas mandelii]